MSMRKATEQEEKDFREATVIIVAIVLILLLVYVYPIVYTYVFGQLEVTTKQSVTTETNAPANICQGLPSACDMSSVFVNTLHGSTVKVTDKHGIVFIDYCKDQKDCHTYRLNDNVTIRKVN